MKDWGELCLKKDEGGKVCSLIRRECSLRSGVSLCCRGSYSWRLEISWIFFDHREGGYLLLIRKWLLAIVKEMGKGCKKHHAPKSSWTAGKTPLAAHKRTSETQKAG